VGGEQVAAVRVTFHPVMSEVDAAQLVKDLALHTPHGVPEADTLPTPLVTVTQNEPDQDIPETTVTAHVAAGADPQACLRVVLDHLDALMGWYTVRVLSSASPVYATVR
jgi:hypothetical protein